MRLVMDLTSCTPGIWVVSAVLPGEIRTSVKRRKVFGAKDCAVHSRVGRTPDRSGDLSLPSLLITVR